MEKTTCLLIDESDQDSGKLTTLLAAVDSIKIIGNTNSYKEGLILVNDLEPNILFLAVKGDGSSAFKLLEKIKKQPTIIFLADNDANLKTFEANRLHFLKKPIAAKDLSQLLNSFQKTHQQLANKMQGLLGKLKLED